MVYKFNCKECGKEVAKPDARGNPKYCEKCGAKIKKKQIREYQKTDAYKEYRKEYEKNRDRTEYYKDYFDSDEWREYMREKQRESRKEGKKKGICIMYGCHNKTGNLFDVCQECRKNQRESAKKYRDRCKEQGICVRPKCNEPIFKGSRCVEHYEKHKERMKKYKRKRRNGPEIKGMTSRGRFGDPVLDIDSMKEGNFKEIEVND